MKKDGVGPAEGVLAFGRRWDVGLNETPREKAGFDRANSLDALWCEKRHHNGSDWQGSLHEGRGEWGRQAALFGTKRREDDAAPVSAKARQLEGPHREYQGSVRQLQPEGLRQGRRVGNAAPWCNYKTRFANQGGYEKENGGRRTRPWAPEQVRRILGERRRARVSWKWKRGCSAPSIKRFVDQLARLIEARAESGATTLRSVEQLAAAGGRIVESREEKGA